MSSSGHSSQCLAFPFIPQSVTLVTVVQVTAEMKMMREEAAAMAAVGKVGIADMFRGIYAWPMFIAIMMMLAQQFSGINVAMFFSTSIFEGAGLGSNAVYATLGMGTCNVAMTVISVYLVRPEPNVLGGIGSLFDLWRLTTILNGFSLAFSEFPMLRWMLIAVEGL